MKSFCLRWRWIYTCYNLLNTVFVFPRGRKFLKFASTSFTCNWCAQSQYENSPHWRHLPSTNQPFLRSVFTMSFTKFIILWIQHNHQIGQTDDTITSWKLLYPLFPVSLQHLSHILCDQELISLCKRMKASCGIGRSNTTIQGCNLLNLEQRQQLTKVFPQIMLPCRMG